MNYVHSANTKTLPFFNDHRVTITQTFQPRPLPPQVAAKIHKGAAKKKRPVRGEAECFTRRRAIGVGARERPRVANALRRRAGGGSRVRFDDPPSIHPPTPQNKTQPPPLEHYVALTGERRTYGHADCGRRRSGSGEQAAQGAQDRMEYDAHGGGVYRSTKCNKYKSTEIEFNAGL